MCLATRSKLGKSTLCSRHSSSEDRHKDYALGKIGGVGGQKSAKSPKCAGFSVRAFEIQLQAEFFLPDILCVHVRMLGTSPRREAIFKTCKNGAIRGRQDAHLSFSEEICENEVTDFSSRVHACDCYRGMGLEKVWVLAILYLIKEPHDGD